MPSTLEPERYLILGSLASIVSEGQTVIRPETVSRRLREQGQTLPFKMILETMVELARGPLPLLDLAFHLECEHCHQVMPMMFREPDEIQGVLKDGIRCQLCRNVCRPSLEDFTPRFEAIEPAFRALSSGVPGKKKRA